MASKKTSAKKTSVKKVAAKKAASKKVAVKKVAAKKAASKKVAVKKVIAKKVAVKKVAAKKTQVSKPVAKKAAKKGAALKVSPKREVERISFDHEAFVSSARKLLVTALERGQKEFGMGSYETFNVDQKKALMSFSSAGKVRLTARAQIVGSHSKETDTWLWSWANKSVLPVMRRRMDEVRAFGAANKLDKLTDMTWPAGEVDAWAMTAIAAAILDAECAYRVPTKTGGVFLLLDGLRRS
jgi:Histone H1-like nucleoprotein HC2